MKRLKKPALEEFGLDIYVADGATSMPFMDVVSYVGGGGPIESGE